jgi:membrane protein
VNVNPAKLVRRLDGFQQRRRTLGFLVAVAKKYGDDQAGQYAALLSYYALLATFPLMLVLVSVLGIALRGNEALQRRVLDSGLTEFPVIGDQLRANIHSLDRSGVALVVGLVIAFVGARGLADVSQAAFNSLWNVPYVHRPGFPASLLRSLLLLVLIGLGAGSTGWVAVTVADGSRSVLVRVVLGVLGLAVNSGLFVAGFRLATAPVVATRSFIPGAVYAALAWQVLLAVGGLLVNHSLRGTSQIYGTFAALLGLIAWFSLQATVTLYAVEADVVRSRALFPRSMVGPPSTQADLAALTDYARVEQRVPDEKITVEFG